MKRRSAISGLAGIAALLLAAPAAPVHAARDTPDLARFYQQEPRWSGCRDNPELKDMQCAGLTVPVDYAHPADGTIEIAVGRYRATGPADRRTGSLVFNFGGPGQSGLTGLAGARADYAELGKRYDLVSFDPRGVGRSAAVKCGKDDGGDSEEGGGDSAPTTPAERTRAVQELKDHAAACRKNTGKVIDHIGSINASRDMDVLRRALGDDKLNYFGTSYGTRLGAVYASQFPATTGRFVLDAVDTLTDDARQSALAQAKAFQRSLDTFLAGCATQGNRCPLGTTPQAAAATLDRLVAKLGRSPVKDKAGDAFTTADLRTALTNSLYSAQLWPALAVGLQQLDQHDDPGVLAEINRVFAGEDADGDKKDKYDNSQLAILAINCADDPVRAADPAAELAAVQKEFTQASPVFGDELAGAAVSCTGWPKGTDYIRDIDRTEGPDILLVGTKGDPATPYQWTGETARRLGNTTVLTYEGEGHGAYSASACVRQRVDTYLLEGKLPDPGDSCPPEQPMDADG
ncbi:alpha/beta hydrolase [Streptomyces sp. NPDC001941]|uniref:alpha/beta hydrolase n=1 Tax=Streptomyces sp. NPDC001941 TaxID=3154659 RepID=UPI0033236987